MDANYLEYLKILARQVDCEIQDMEAGFAAADFDRFMKPCVHIVEARDRHGCIIHTRLDEDNRTIDAYPVDDVGCKLGPAR